MVPRGAYMEVSGRVKQEPEPRESNSHFRRNRILNLTLWDLLKILTLYKLMVYDYLSKELNEFVKIVNPYFYSVIHMVPNISLIQSMRCSNAILLIYNKITLK